MGPRRPALRHDHHLVSGRRRFLHGLYRDRGSRPGVRGRRVRLFRAALHHHRLSVGVPRDAAPVGGLSAPPLCHRCRFRPWPLRQPLAGACRRADRTVGDDALHRPAARRHAGGDRRARHRRRQRLAERSATHHRLHGARGLYLRQRAARTGDDRLRQGRDDLYRGDRRGRHHPADPRRLRRRVRGRRPRLPRQGRRHRHLAAAGAVSAVRDLGPGLGVRRLPLSPHHDGRAELVERRRDPPQRHPVAPTRSCSA